MKNRFFNGFGKITTVVLVSAAALVFGGCDQSLGGASGLTLRGTVTISGTAQVGGTLTAELTGFNVPEETPDVLYQYVWQRGDAADGTFTADTEEDAAEGNNTASYLLTEADLNKHIRVVVSVTGYSGSVSSEPVGQVTAATVPIYTVIGYTGEHGSVSSNPTSAAAGATVTLTVSAGSGYMFTANSLTVTKNGGGTVTVAQETGNANIYTFTMPADNVTVSAGFEELPANTYSINTETMTGGTVGISSMSATERTEITLTVTPAEGYQLAGTPVVTKEGGGTVTAGGSGNTYTFTMPAANVTVTATFTAISYSVSIAGGITNGSVSANPASATIGQQVTLTVTPSANYKLKSGTLKVNNGAVTVSDNAPYTFTMPAADVTVTAEFEAAGGDDGPSTSTLTAEVSFAQTYNNTSETSVSAPSGSGANQTATLSVVEEPAAFFQVIKGAGQTITKGGADAEKVTLITSGSVDGSTASDTAILISVNMEDLLFDGAFGGGSSATVPTGTETRTFTLTVSETGKASRIITVNMDITLDGDTETSIYHREGTPGNYHYVKVRDAELTDADKQNYAGFTDTTQYDFAAYTVGPVIDLQNAFVWVERHGDGGTVWGTETVPSGFANGTTEGYSEYRLFVKKDQQIGKIRLSFLNNYGSFANNQLMGENDTRDSISIQLYGAGSSGTEKKISRSGEYTLEVDANNKMYALNYNSDSSADGLITLARLPNTSDSYTHKYKTLILGKNITLYGDGETEPVTGSGGAWRTIRVETFIRINENSIVIMEPNAKITNFYSKVARGIAHLASASARFYMRGGEITGNTIAASAGVITIAGNKSEYEGGTFGVVEKSGGQVYGNFSGAITVNYVTDKSRVLVKSLE